MAGLESARASNALQEEMLFGRLPCYAAQLLRPATIVSEQIGLKSTRGVCHMVHVYLCTIARGFHVMRATQRMRLALSEVNQLLHGKVPVSVAMHVRSDDTGMASKIMSYSEYHRKKVTRSKCVCQNNTAIPKQKMIRPKQMSIASWTV
eukprot:6177083-Pleurochrysis_carterae.AAC.3